MPGFLEGALQVDLVRFNSVDLCNLGGRSSIFQRLLEGISSSDPGDQMQAVASLTEALSMSTEESLAGFKYLFSFSHVHTWSIDEFVPALIAVIDSEANPEASCATSLL